MLERFDGQWGDFFLVDELSQLFIDLWNRERGMLGGIEAPHHRYLSLLVHSTYCIVAWVSPVQWSDPRRTGEPVLPLLRERDSKRPTWLVMDIFSNNSFHSLVNFVSLFVANRSVTFPFTTSSCAFSSCSISTTFNDFWMKSSVSVGNAHRNRSCPADWTLHVLVHRAPASLQRHAVYVRLEI